jgi:hypothetical protein
MITAIHEALVIAIAGIIPTMLIRLRRRGLPSARRPKVLMPA